MYTEHTWKAAERRKLSWLKISSSSSSDKKELQKAPNKITVATDSEYQQCTLLCVARNLIHPLQHRKRLLIKHTYVDLPPVISAEELCKTALAHIMTLRNYSDI